MCVLPSETWSCNSKSDESTVVKEKYEAPEVINTYLDLNSDPLNLSEVVDSPYFLNSPTDTNINEETTPYSWNEVSFSNFENEKENKDFIKKISGDYVVNNTREKDSFPRFENKTLLISSVTWLDRIIDTLLIHQSLKILSDETFLVRNSEIKTENPITQDILHNHFVTNYIIRNNFENKDATLSKNKIKTRKDSTTYGKLETAISKGEVQSIDTRYIHQLMDESKANESLISIKNNLDNKQYFMIQNYEFLKDQLNPNIVDIIPCSSGIRLPNNTDCTKYYICEAKTTTIREFSCPPYTGFNEEKKICDTKTYSSCKKIENQNLELNSDFEEVKDENGRLSKKNLCETVGKVADPSSVFHYHLCFSNGRKSSNIESVRMMCPNNLIFCNEKKICATKEFCARHN